MSLSGNKAAIYVRNFMGNENCIQKQTEKCQNLAIKQGYEIYKIYTDKDSSFENLNIMLNETNSFSKILVVSLDRLSRNGSEISRILNLLNNCNIELETCKNESSNETSRFFCGMNQVISEYVKTIVTERETLERREMAEPRT